ncbi:hypothetical protein [Reyranella sp.]|uniref:hypothetical protein n=1 Tax=Reyranella sp. TaxID=1929291 RepID=UPI003D0F1DEB
MKRLGLVAVLALGGCIDAQVSERRIYERYNGRPISDLILQWGRPETEIERPQGTIFTFANSMQYTSTTPVTTTATIGAASVIATSSVPTTDTLLCRVNVYTDRQQRIVGLRHQGANGACAQMYDRLH